MLPKFLLYCLYFCLFSITIKGQNNYITNGQYTANVLELADLTDTNRNRNIPVKVHYPTAQGIFPLIVISHGAGGDWDTHFALANYLATYGYVVFCVEHIGSNTRQLKSSIRIFKNLDKMLHDGNEVLGRPKDISFVIDQAISLNATHEILKNKMDTQNIGVLGHSFGAFTSMVIAGMQPALDWLTPAGTYGKGLGQSMKDNRVKACVALSPQGVGEPFFIKESFASLSTPLLGISGTEDKQHNGLTAMNRYEAFALWQATSYNVFVWLNNAHHLDFSDSEGGETHGLRSKNRKEVQKIVRVAALCFFNYHLKGDSNAPNLLSQDGLQPYLGKKIDGVEVRVVRK